MPEVRRLRKRGATIEVVAYGEALFANGAPADRFLSQLRENVATLAAFHAPSNKRPRWGHYGKPLKQTIRRSAKSRRGVGPAGRFHLHAAVGSTAPYSFYVDQGTGIYAGNGPYKAEILPPWERFSPSLYEAAWIHPGTGHRIKPVLIKGQKGQFFFDIALHRAFQHMRMQTIHIPGDVTNLSGGGSGLRTAPAGLANFLGNTPNSPAFQKSLEEWRAWRDAAFDAGFLLGRAQNRLPVEAVGRRRSSGKTRIKRKGRGQKAPAKPRRDKPGNDDNAPTRGELQARAIAQFQKQNPTVRIGRRSSNGLEVIIPGRGAFVIPWSKIYGLIGETFP